MSPGGQDCTRLRTSGVEHVSNLSHLRGYTSSRYTPPPIHHCFRAALGDIKSRAPLACPEGLQHMIPGQKKLFGSTAGAHSKKPPECVEIMRAGGMWAPTVQLCGSGPVWLWEPRLPPPPPPPDLQLGLEVCVLEVCRFQCMHSVETHPPWSRALAPQPTPLLPSLSQAWPGSCRLRKDSLRRILD